MKGLSLASQPRDSLKKNKPYSVRGERDIMIQSQRIADAVTGLPLGYVPRLLHSVAGKHRNLIMDDRHSNIGLLRDFLLFSFKRKMRCTEHLEREISSIEEDVAWVDKQHMELGLCPALRPAHDIATVGSRAHIPRETQGGRQRILPNNEYMNSKRLNSGPSLVADMLSAWGIDWGTRQANSRHKSHPSDETHISDLYAFSQLGIAQLAHDSPHIVECQSVSSKIKSIPGIDSDSEIYKTGRRIDLRLQESASIRRSLGDMNCTSVGSENVKSMVFDKKCLSTCIRDDSEAQEKMNLSATLLLPVSGAKIKKVFTHFSNLQQIYSDARCGDDNNSVVLRGSRVKDAGSIAVPSLDHFARLITDSSSCDRLAVVGQVQHIGSSNTSASNPIISSIEIDMEDFCFATAGVSRLIHFFRFADVCNGYEHSGLPAQSISTSCKLSCLSYSKHIQKHIASSDYEGVISVWDIEIGTALVEYEEHCKRAWTVDFCRTDPRLLASGSDDGRVKIWSTNQVASVLELDMRANVCCAQYGPNSAHQLAVGCADHMVHLFDLRSPSEPLAILSGHRKAVSYVRFLPSGRELVSASTDSTLCVWDVHQSFASAGHERYQESNGITTGTRLTRVHDGHVNEKNFVGLSVGAGEYIACGSETNEVILYHKELRRPLARYNFAEDTKFPITHSTCLARHTSVNDFDSDLSTLMSTGITDLGNGAQGAHVTTHQQSQPHFISATCWKGNDATVLAASSSGLVRVLQLVNNQG